MKTPVGQILPDHRLDSPRSNWMMAKCRNCRRFFFEEELLERLGRCYECHHDRLDRMKDK